MYNLYHLLYKTESSLSNKTTNYSLLRAFGMTITQLSVFHQKYGFVINASTSCCRMKWRFLSQLILFKERRLKKESADPSRASEWRRPHCVRGRGERVTALWEERKRRRRWWNTACQIQEITSYLSFTAPVFSLSPLFTPSLRAPPLYLIHRPVCSLLKMKVILNELIIQQQPPTPVKGK